MESYIHELASLYALDALDGAERTAFEKHLNEGCATCRQEVASFRETAGELAEVCATPPPADLRRRVLKSVRRAPQAPGVVLNFAGLLLSRSNEIPWEPYSPGVAHRPLFRDEQRQYTTSLVRLDPGAHYPPHRHSDTEELFILSGDLQVAGFTMRAGDYCHAERDSKHPDTHTVEGCTLLMMSSDTNELLTKPA